MYTHIPTPRAGDAPAPRVPARDLRAYTYIYIYMSLSLSLSLAIYNNILYYGVHYIIINMSICIIMNAYV